MKFFRDRAMGRMAFSPRLLSSFSLPSCPQPEASSLLEEAGQLVEKHPDSAMLLIDFIFYPEKSLNHEYYMRFLVTQVQEKYKVFSC